MGMLLFRLHALQRMLERDISPHRVRRALEENDTLEDYSSEMPQPGRLILGAQGARHFHVVISESIDLQTVITVYLPDPAKWKPGGRSRRA